jgi:hypothetical protein
LPSERGERIIWISNHTIFRPSITCILISAFYPVTGAILSRARFYAGTFALQEALYGLEDGDQKAFERGIAQYR